MPASLTINKISRPRMSEVLPRERLFEHLDRSLIRPVTWVHGPGGSGKSTLIASFLDSRKLPCLWYQLDAGDGDPATFFYYLGLAAQKASPRHRRPLPLLTPEYQLNLSIFARRYFEQLFARLSPPYLLVLDDYHEVAHDSPLHKVLKEACEEVTAGINIVVISRKPAPAELARLRARQWISYLDWDRLRLTTEETRGIVELLNHTQDWQPVLEQLHDRIQGWVAGLVLILEGGRSDERWLTGERSREDIFNYFAEELFDKTEASLRDFLVKTALLPTIVPTLAEELTGNAEAASILEELYRTHFFTEKRYDKEVFYRFHPLFREYLINKGKSDLTPDQLGELQRAASLLLERDGKVDEAALLRAEAGDWEGLGTLILNHSATLIGQGRSQTVLQWLGHLPPERLEREPYLLFWMGAALFAYDPVQSQLRFRSAFDAFRSTGDRSGLFLSWCAVVDTAIQASEYTPMLEWVQVLTDVLGEDPVLPTRELEVRVALSLFNALAFVAPDSRQIIPLRERAFSLVATEPIADGNLFVTTALHLVAHFIYQGDLARAGIVLNLLKESAKLKGTSPLVVITVRTIEAHYAFATAALDDCLAKTAEAAALAEKTGIRIWDMHLTGHALAAALAKGDDRLGAELVARMSAGLPDCRQVDRAYYYWMAAWKAALGGSTAEALHLLQLAVETVTPIGFLAPQLAATISMAQLEIQRGELARGADLIEQVRTRVEETGSAYLLFYLLITEAFLYLRRGDEAQAKQALSKGFLLGREHRLENFFFWLPELMAELCAKALEAGIEADYARDLVSSRRLTLPTPLVPTESWPWPMKVYTLGRFELVRAGAVVTFSGKVQKKPLELLKLLVALGGKETTPGQIADLMWSDADGDMARNALKVTLHRLRDMLGVEKAIQIQEGRLVMDRGFFWTDAWAVEDLLTAAQLRGEAGEEEEAIRLTREAIRLYRGPFLPQDSDKPWAFPLRKRLHDRYVLNLVTLGAMAVARKEHHQGIAHFLQGLEIDELQEQFYQHLIKCYLDLGLRADAIRTYRRCENTLSSQLGISPSPATTSLYLHALEGAPLDQG